MRLNASDFQHAYRVRVAGILMVGAVLLSRLRPADESNRHIIQPW